METLINNLSYKVVSKFRFWPKLLLISLTLLLCFINAFVLINFDTFFAYNKPFHFLTFPFIPLNAIVFPFLFRELNEKAYSITISGNTITRVRNFGFGFKKVYKTGEITGFSTYKISDRETANEYLYLIAGDDKVLKLSAFYHQNYHELKSLMVQHQIQNLGVERWTIWKHITKRTY